MFPGNRHSHHGLVVDGQADAAVHQLCHGTHTVNVGVFGKEPVGEHLPLDLILLGTLGKAVSGEVHQKELLVDLVEVDKKIFLVDLPGYGFAKRPKDTITSLPIRSDGKNWEVVQGLDINEFSRAKIDASNAELLDEQKTISEIFA